MPTIFTRAFHTSLLSIVATATGSMMPFAAHAEDTSLCVASACVGMTGAEVAKLNLATDSSPYNLKVSPTPARHSPNQDFGLDANGKRLWFTGGAADKGSLSEFIRQVKTMCKFAGTWTDMKTSDGQKMQLTLSPVIRDGKIELILTEITRPLPPNLTQGQKADFIAQAKTRYGSAWADAYASSKKGPKATVKFDAAKGQVLLLSMPRDVMKSREAMLSQHGCSSKPSID